MLVVWCISFVTDVFVFVIPEFQGTIILNKSSSDYLGLTLGSSLTSRYMYIAESDSGEFDTN